MRRWLRFRFKRLRFRSHDGLTSGNRYNVDCRFDDA
jgi:hypothetical protein